MGHRSRNQPLTIWPCLGPLSWSGRSRGGGTPLSAACSPLIPDCAGGSWEEEGSWEDLDEAPGGGDALSLVPRLFIVLPFRSEACVVSCLFSRS